MIKRSNIGQFLALQNRCRNNLSTTYSDIRKAKTESVATKSIMKQKCVYMYYL